MTNCNNELHKHKAADTIKWIVAFVLIIAIMGVVICLALQVGGVYDFFNKEDKPVEEESGQEEVVDPQDQVMTGAIYEHGIALTSVAVPAASGDNVKTLTASVKNAEGKSDVLDTTVEWSVAWKDSASAWATGKTVTEYLTCVPTSEGGLVATVTVLQPFGEQIIIKCTSVVDSEKFATATVDYAKRFHSARILMDGKDGSSFYLDLNDGKVEHKFSMSNYTYGVGTKIPNNIGETAELTVSSEMKTLLSGLSESVGNKKIYEFVPKDGSFDLKSSSHFSWVLPQYPTGAPVSAAYAEYDLGFATMKIWENSYTNLSKATTALKKALLAKDRSMLVFTLHVSLEFIYYGTPQLTLNSSVTQLYLLGTCSFPSIAVNSVTFDENSLLF